MTPTSPCCLHSNVLLGPPWAEQVMLTGEVKLTVMLTGDIVTLPSGDTVDKIKKKSSLKNLLLKFFSITKMIDY